MAGVFEDSLALQHYLRGTNPNSGLQRIPAILQQRQAQALQLAAEQRRLQQEQQLMGLRQQHALALQSVRDQGDLKQAEAQADAYVKRAESAEQGRLKRELMTRVKVYPKPGESDEDFIARAGEEASKREEEEAKRAASVLEGFDKQSLDLDNEINEVLQTEQERQTQVSEQYALKQFNGSIDVDPKEKATIQAALAKGFSLDDAIAQLKKPERQAAVRQALDGYRLDGQAYAQQTMPKSVAQRIQSLESKQKAVGYRANQFMTTPAGQKGNSYRFMAPSGGAQRSEPKPNEATGPTGKTGQTGMGDFLKALQAAGVNTERREPAVPAGQLSLENAVRQWAPGGAPSFEPPVIDTGGVLSNVRRPVPEPEPAARALSLQPMAPVTPEQRAMELRGKLRNILDFNFKAIAPFEGPERAMPMAVEAMSKSPEAQELSQILSMQQMTTQPTMPRTNRVTQLQAPPEAQFEVPPALMRLP
jgi:hypothetical protein